MGPNSGGGKKNKDNNNPAIGGARNRFSKWKPPTKDLKDKFSKQHDKRVTEHEISDTTSSKPSSKDNGGSKSKQSDKASQQTAMGGSGEMLTIHASVVGELLRIFQVETTPVTSNISLSVDKKAVNEASQAASATPVVKEVMVHHLSSKPKTAEFQSGGDSLEARQLRTMLTNYGFELDEVAAVLRSFASTKDESSTVLHALSKVAKKELAPGQKSTQEVNAYDLSSNEELMGELEVLSSIYMEHVSYRSCALLGNAGCIVDVSIPLEEDLVRQVFQQSAAGKKATSHHVQVRVFIPSVSTYPRPASLLYGWILPSDFDNSKSAASTGKGKISSAPSTTSLLPVAVARQLSVQAMSHIHAYQFQFEAPAVFEFLQNIRENLAAALAAHYIAHPTNIVGAPMEPKSLPADATGKAKNDKKGAKGGSAHKTTPVELPPAPEVFGPPPMPPRPTTSFMQTLEYRTALSGAFSASLVGEAARARAHAELEFILPKVGALLIC